MSNSEGLLKIQILKVFNNIHDIDFLERLYKYLTAKALLDEQENSFYSDKSVTCCFDTDEGNANGRTRGN